MRLAKRTLLHPSKPRLEEDRLLDLDPMGPMLEAVKEARRLGSAILFLLVCRQVLRILTRQ